MKRVVAIFSKFRISIKTQLVLWLASFTAGLIVTMITGNMIFVFFSPLLFVGVNLLLRTTVFWMRSSGKAIDL
ncbi:hypothetical protein HZF05_15605 [Sphingomonas sp. CGMCC 1.13654]|uniref:Uncharacterized protein n=1 Tax=Sphingomonas chungangi TaxID=2683589 RepID=A0A838L7Q0_9SPHN|nr:hypothetical protein [Sphingomonas chungangi]MBA2935513.1 hypothetical protein [Sphingomonas chungangi]MVW57020.1 hypothetical protein [Sphingomonas chungangi]